MHPASLCRGITRVVTGFLAFVLLVPLIARAQGSIEVQRYLDSVNLLYENLEYERALEQIASAKRLTRGMEDDAVLALYEGVILADLGKNEEAIAAFKAALFLKPEAKLPVRVSPKVVRLFEGLRQQVKQEQASLLARRDAEQQRLDAPPQQAETKPRQEEQELVPQAPQTVLAPIVMVQQQLALNLPREAPPEGNVSWRADLRSHALLPSIAGGALLALGGVSWSLAKGEQSRLRSGDPSLTSPADVQRSMSRGQWFQTVGVGLVGAGVVGLGLAAGIYALGVPEAPILVGAGTDGTSAFVYGRWP
jgi:hypothetical protein